MRDNEPAPYRFVPLNEEIVCSPVRGDALNVGEPQAGHLDASITITWKPETPFLIGQKSTEDFDQPFRLGGDGPYAIPGSSLKGMLRSVMEIICHGRLAQINGHHQYGLRDFDHPHYQDKMKEDNIKAGWLIKDSGKLYIQPVNYYRVKIKCLTEKYQGIENTWPTLSLEKKYKKSNQLNGNILSNEIDFKKEQKFILDNGIARLDDIDGDQKGVLVFSGGMPSSKNGKGAKFQKKYEYIFVDNDSNGRVKLEKTIFDVFEINHSKPGKNRRIPHGTWRDLQKTWNETSGIPIFYSGDLNNQSPKRFCFGLTRLFKIPHQYSVYEVLERNNKKHTQWPEETTPDIVEGLFGFVYETDEVPENVLSTHTAQKGRIAVGFAICPAEGVDVANKVDTVMMGPRASFSPFYLMGNKLDYSDPEAKLAGRKRYPVRYPENELPGASHQIREKLLATVTDQNREEQQGTFSYLLPSDKLCFTGDIRLHNVHPVELGAVLWALSFGQPNLAHFYRHSLGRGKAFGMGQMAVTSIVLTTERYDGENDDSINGQVALQKQYIEFFTHYMKKCDSTWEHSPSKKALQHMSHPAIGAKMLNDDKLRYLGNHKDHQALRKDRKANENSKDRFLPEQLLRLPKYID